LYSIPCFVVGWKYKVLIGGNSMIEIFIFILLFLGIGMVEKNFKAIRKQNDQIIELLEKLDK
jgi:hypothetical protein